MRVNETEVRFLSTCRTHTLKPPHHWPGKALTLQKVEDFRISGMSAHKGSKFDSPRHRPLLSHRIHPWHSFLLEGDSTLVMLGRVDHRGTEGLSMWNHSYTILYLNRDRQGCIVVSQPPATLHIPIYQFQ
jgi:hypothetical protein